MIVQNTSQDGKTDISFTMPKADGRCRVDRQCRSLRDRRTA
jgi:hypothetical protein